MSFTIEVSQGMYIKFENELYQIIEKEFYSPGKGGAFNRVKLRNLRTGKIIGQVFRSNEKIEEVTVDQKTVQYLYTADSDVYFMDPVSFDQITVPLDSVPGRTDYLMEEAKYIAMIHEDEVLSVQIPIKFTMKVIETSGAVKGNTATNAYKEATLETGVKLQVPLFINTGDKVMINTDSGEYISKVN